MAQRSSRLVNRFAPGRNQTHDFEDMRQCSTTTALVLQVLELSRGVLGGLGRGEIRPFEAEPRRDQKVSFRGLDLETKSRRKVGLGATVFSTDVSYEI